MASAQEKIIFDILDNLKNLPDIKREQKRLLNEIFSELRTTLATLNINSQQANNNNQNSNQNIQNSNKNIRSITDLTSRIEKGYDNVVRNMDNFSRAFERGVRDFRLVVERGPFEILENTLREVPVIGSYVKIFTQLYSLFDKLVDTYSGMARAGVIFSGNLGDIIAAGKDLRLSFEETGEFFAKYANLLNRGNREFLNFIDQSMKTSDKILSYGFDIATLRDSAAEFLTIQRNLGFLRQINAEEQSKAFHETIENFYSVSTRLGIAATELMESLKSLSEDPEARVAMRSLSRSGQQILALLNKTAPEVSRMMVQAIARGGLERADIYREFIGTETMPLITEIFRSIVTGTGSVEDVLLSISSFRDVISEDMRRFSLMGLTSVVGVLNDLDILSKITIDDLKTTQEEIDSNFGRNIVQARNRIQATISDMSADIVRRIVESGDMMKNLQSFILDLTKNITTIANNTFWVDLLVGFTNSAIKLTNAIVSAANSINSFFGLNGPIATIITTSLLAFLPKGLIGILSSKAPNILTSVSSILGSRLTSLLISIFSDVKKTFLALTAGFFGFNEIKSLMGLGGTESTATTITPSPSGPTGTVNISPSLNVPPVPNVAPATPAGPPPAASFGTTSPITPQAEKLIGETGSLDLEKKISETNRSLREITQSIKQISEQQEKKTQQLNNLKDVNEQTLNSISSMISP